MANEGIISLGIELVGQDKFARDLKKAQVDFTTAADQMNKVQLVSAIGGSGKKYIPGQGYIENQNQASLGVTGIYGINQASQGYKNKYNPNLTPYVGKTYGTMPSATPSSAGGGGGGIIYPPGGTIYGGGEERNIPSKDKLKSLDDETNKHKKTVGSLAEKYSALALRAAVVIPIWQALRTVYQTLTDTVAAGLKRMVEMDSILIRIKNVLPTINIKELTTQIDALSKETGKPLQEIADAFYRFADAGLDAKTSMSGMNASVKASLAMFGETGDTAKVLADIYVMLGDKITAVTTVEDKMKYVMSLIAVLQKSNKFELGEYTEGLKTFGATAAATGLTIEQMTFLLAKAHTFMQRGSAGGSQMARAFDALNKNMKDVKMLFPDIINPEGMNRFDLLLTVIQKLAESGQATQNVFGELSEIFGMRATKATAAFVINAKALVKEWKEFSSMKPPDFFGELDRQTANAEEQFKVLLAKVERTKEMIGESFIQGVTGADNFKQALEDLIPILEQVGSLAKLVGQALSLGTGAYVDQINKEYKAKDDLLKEIHNAIIGKSSAEDIKNLYEELNKNDGGAVRNGIAIDIEADLHFGRKNLLENLKKAVDKAEKDLKQGGAIAVDLSKIEVTKPIETKTSTILKDITSEYEIQEAFIKRRATLGYNEIEIEKQILLYYVSQEQTVENQKKVLEERIKLAQMYNAEIIKLSDELKSSFEGAFEGLLKGEGTLSSMFSRIGDTFRDQMFKSVSGGLTDKIFKNTGIGEMFGTSAAGLRRMISGDTGPASSISGAFEDGSQLTYEMIIKGFAVGSGQIVGGASATANWGGSTTVNGVTTNGWNLPGFGEGGFWSSPMGSQRLPSGQVQGGSVSKTNPYLRTGPTRGQVAVGAAGTVLTGYSQYQSAKAGGASPAGAIMSGIGGAAFGIAGGLAAGPAGGLLLGMGPVGWLILGVGLLVGSMLMKGKKSEQTSVSTQTTENKVASKIDVTNKNLEVINRNLVAMRQDLTYILPSSAYFAEKRSIDDIFAINAKRGLQ